MTTSHTSLPAKYYYDFPENWIGELAVLKLWNTRIVCRIVGRGPRRGGSLVGTFDVDGETVSIIAPMSMFELKEPGYGCRR